MGNSKKDFALTLNIRCGAMRHAGESAAIMDFKQGGKDKLQLRIERRRKKRSAPPPQQEKRWQMLLADEFNKAYKTAAKHLLVCPVLRYVDTLSLSGLASANELSNPGFEDPEIGIGGAAGDEPTDWTRNDVSGGVNNSLAGAVEGTQYFATGFGPGSVADVNASQTVDVPAMYSPYGLARWYASGEYWTWDSAVDNVDFAYWSITGLGDIGGMDPLPIDPGVWQTAEDDGNIAMGATSATITVGGTAVAGNEVPDAAWDDMDLGFDCVTDFAKVSGKVKASSGEGGEFQRGLVSFSGAFGPLESGDLVGEIDVNYRAIKTSCNYTPEGEFLYGGTGPYGAAYLTDYTCDDGFDSGAAWIIFLQGTGGSNKGGNKDRGCVQLLHDGVLGLIDVCYVGGLDNGNVDVMPPPAP